MKMPLRKAMDTSGRCDDNAVLHCINNTFYRIFGRIAQQKNEHRHHNIRCERARHERYQ